MAGAGLWNATRSSYYRLAFMITDEVMQASKGTTNSVLDLRPLNQRDIRFGTGNLGLVQVMDLGRVPTNATLLNWRSP